MTVRYKLQRTRDGRHFYFEVQAEGNLAWSAAAFVVSSPSSRCSSMYVSLVARVS